LAAQPVTFDWARIGNAGNAPDPQTSIGAVSQPFAISKTEVTNGQYAAFLNAADPTGANELWLYSLDLRETYGGILDNGLADGARYVVKPGREHEPLVYVSWYSALRFVNWLNNGQGSADTETGAYTIPNRVHALTTPASAQVAAASTIQRNAGAKVWLPSENEWYKAAYHNAAAGTASSYFDYATGSDQRPISDRPGDNPAAVNYYQDDGLANDFNDGFAVSGSTSFPSIDPSLFVSPLTNVGAYTQAPSPYGTFDQNGNVWEYTDSPFTRPGPPPGDEGATRVVRGGGWRYLQSLLTPGYDPASELQSTGRGDRRVVGFFGDLQIGFRVATVPEPSSLALTALLVACRRWRRSPRKLRRDGVVRAASA
jgi:formylglycine-generating enzyme required for sulfatase activity